MLVVLACLVRTRPVPVPFRKVRDQKVRFSSSMGASTQITLRDSQPRVRVLPFIVDFRKTYHLCDSSHEVR
jgi:hypothetical protein